jgi:Na+:H+ antiporter, NhaA family
MLLELLPILGEITEQRVLRALRVPPKSTETSINLPSREREPMSTPLPGRIQSTLRKFLDNESSAGLLLMGVAALALITANSPASDAYFSALHLYLGPLSLQHWINDALMALFFLLVGLEIKREILDGQLSFSSRRILPGAAAAGGMLVPALIYAAFNANNPATAHGWAISAATDIAFAVGVLSLLGHASRLRSKCF